MDWLFFIIIYFITGFSVFILMVGIIKASGTKHAIHLALIAAITWPITFILIFLVNIADICEFELKK